MSGCFVGNIIESLSSSTRHTPFLRGRCSKSTLGQLSINSRLYRKNNKLFTSVTCDYSGYIQGRNLKTHLQEIQNVILKLVEQPNSWLQIKPTRVSENFPKKLCATSEKIPLVRPTNLKFNITESTSLVNAQILNGDNKLPIAHTPRHCYWVFFLFSSLLLKETQTRKQWALYLCNKRNQKKKKTFFQVQMKRWVQKCDCPASSRREETKLQIV